MGIDQRLTKVYSDQSYKFTTIVRHQGVVIAFAMDQSRRIYYAVLDPRAAQEGDGKTDADSWSTDPRPLRFPTEITDVGYSAGGNAVMPTVALGGRSETDRAALFPEEIDPFLSSTARLSADCPFCLYSDGAHVFLFRQAIPSDHPDAVFVLQSGATSGDASRKDLLRDPAGAKVPVANASLLCDRFLLVGGQLEPTAEIRFRRSRHKTLPDSAKDSLGPQDMNDNYFQEPTQHLSLVRNLKDGGFCALQVPTGMPDVKYWQIFAFNSRTQRMDSFNIERDPSGLFNTQGTQCYTSPDPQYQPSVFEREPGKCPFTQRELIPVAAQEGFAESGVLLDGPTTSISLPGPPGIALGGAPFTIEAWLRADQIGPADRPILARARKAGPGFALSLDAKGMLSVRGASGAAAITATTPLQVGQWTHLAVIFDGQRLYLLLNGDPASPSGTPDQGDPGTPILLGAGFKGMIDEVRLWSRARSTEEIRRDRATCLVGQETGLAAYYRCDEAQGTVLYDQTDSAQNGALQGATFATSDAPVGNHPGVRRDSFRFTGRTIDSPPAGLLYYQQERSGPGRSLLKRQARVLLTCALGGPGPDGLATDKRYVAALDFAVAIDGSLAQVPDEVGLTFIDTAVQSATLDQISAVEQELTRLKANAAAQNPNTALSFNNSNDLVSLGPKIRLDSGDFSVEFWMKRQQTGQCDMVLGQGQWVANLGLSIGLTDWNGFRFDFSSDALDSPAYTDTDWHHWAVTFNRATRQRIIYRDGVQVATDTAKNAYAGSGELIVGQSSPAGYPAVSARGLLDELRIWSKVRKPEEIKADLSRHLQGTEAGLVALYTFAGRDLRDRSGHGNDGKVSGGNPTVAPSILQSVQVDTSRIDQAKIDALQTQLATMTGGLRGGDIAVPMPLVSIDGVGLTIMGGLLGFAFSNNRPTLLDSTTGDVVVYFRGQNSQLYAAYYDTTVSRHALVLSAGSQPVRLVARSAGLDLASATVTVQDGDAADRCTLHLDTPRLSETWPAVPRHPQRLADVLNGQAQPKDYDYRKARCSRVGGDLSRGSLIFAAVPGNASDPIKNGAAALAGLAATTRFWSDAPGRAFRFNGLSQRLTLPAAQLPQVEVSGPTTIEAWVNPASFPQRARVLHANTGGSQYTLGLEAAPSQDALSFNGGQDLVSLGSKIRLDSSDFSIELWLKRQQAGQCDMILGQGQWVANLGLSLGLTDGNTLRVDFSSDALDSPVYTDTDWHHWAVTFNRATRQRIIYRDGVQVASDTAKNAYAGSGDLVVGQSSPAGYAAVSARCLLDELRIWNKVRKPEEIKADLSRHLQGSEAGLVGLYTFTGRDLRDRSGHGNDGKVTGGNPTLGPSALSTRDCRVFAGVGQSVVRSKDTIAANTWQHLALSFNQSWALQFNGTSHWLSGGSEDALNLGEELTIEVFLQVEALGRAAGILSKGRLADGTDQHSPYQLTLGADGKVTFAFESGSGATVALTSTEALQAGVFCRLAAVRKSCRQIDGASLSTWQELALYFDRRPVGTLRYDGDAAGRHSGALEIGRACAGRQERYFQGILSEVRLWSAPREPKDLGRALKGSERDLVACFAFAENRGNVTRDSAGGREGRIYGARWTKNPDPSGSALQLYINGVTVPTEPVPATAALITDGPGDPQFTLGAVLRVGLPQDVFCGVLEEVRVWRTRRTAAEIMDNLFTRLRGERKDLLAYYTFDDSSTLPDSTRLIDEGPRGNHLPYPSDGTRPDIVLSTAPVQSDTAQVRGALGGVKTAFQDSIDCEPAVAEYGVMQEDVGAMKRCYSMIKGGTWQIVSGYKVGDLVTEWLGQAQFDPQVLGFVEGAPPVPGENLVAGPLDPEKDDPSGATALTFTQADAVLSTVSTSAETSLRTGLELGVTLGGGEDVFLVTAPLGFGTMESLVHFAVEGRLSVALEFAQAWSSESAVSQGQNTAKALSVGLSGFWQSSKAAASALGQRFAPNNTGFALVQSATADVFALRLQHTGALVSYRMRPNPDIPRDWNVIPFPLNPFYVKQGTLDGCVGIDDHGAKLLDPSYPQAASSGEYSYYKPREAYALKRRIAREQQLVQAGYARASTDPFARASPLVKEAVASLGPSAGGDGAAGDPAAPRRSVVNTYVWTAAGGFFAESTETVDSFLESAAGSYSFNMSATAGFSVDFEVGPVGVLVQGDATFGGGFSETRTRAREATRTFGVEVSCSVPGDLQQYGADGAPVFDAQGHPVKAPGRVDGYRWMTFLLAASAHHHDDLFRKVIDPLWLKQSNDASAVALRQAQQADKSPPCWRILHRVTYVSRILPKVPAADAPPVERAMQAENIASNWELIKRLDPHVKTATGSLNELAAATRDALTQELPALLPHADQITRYLALYYGMQ